MTWEIPNEPIDREDLRALNDALRNRRIEFIGSLRYIDGVYVNSSEAAIDFVKMYARVLKRLGIRYVFSHVSVYGEPFPNALYIFAHDTGNHVIRRQYVINRRLSTVAFDPSTPVTDLDVAVVINTRDYRRVIVGYNREKNIFVASDFTHLHAPDVWLTFLEWLAKLKNGDIKPILEEIPCEFVALLGSLLDDIIRAEETRGLLPFSITFKCEGSDVKIERSGTIVIKVPRIDRRSNIVALATTHDLRKAPVPFRVVVEDLVIRVRPSGAISARARNAFVDVEGETVDHPNVADSGNVCLGSLEHVEIPETITCEWIERVANMVIDVLLKPSTSAYNARLFGILEDIAGRDISEWPRVSW